MGSSEPSALKTHLAAKLDVGTLVEVLEVIVLLRLWSLEGGHDCRCRWVVALEVVVVVVVGARQL